MTNDQRIGEIALENRIIGDDGQAFMRGLSDEHTVERILVMAGQFQNGLGMVRVDIQPLEALGCRRQFAGTAGASCPGRA